MDKYIVITSIFEPTHSVKEFSKLTDYKLIVVGDKKTPGNWNCENVIFLSVNHQKQLEFKINKTLPYNHYCRKMLGYLYAMKNNAEFIIDTDDDNVPKPDWNFPAFQGTFDCIPDDTGFINIYQLFTNQKIWPRGLPLNLILKKFDIDKFLYKEDCKIGVWQGLVDGDPDVDAIYRLTSNKSCKFIKRAPVVLGNGTIAPFNTQNTIIRKDLFALMYLPSFVTFRFTDILRGLIFQPIMWLYDFKLGFISSTVNQLRNQHDFFNDFVSEIPMYHYSELIVEYVSSVVSRNNSISDNLFNAYHALFNNSVVTRKEIDMLELWLEDVQCLKII